MEKANSFVKVLSDCAVLFDIVASWIMETIAFVLLPLIIYLIVFFALSTEIGELVKLPELMFIAIILFADVTHKLISFYRDSSQGFSRRLVFTISFGLTGIVVSAIFLAFSMIAQHKPDFALPPPFYGFQVAIFLLSLLISGLCSTWITWRKDKEKSVPPRPIPQSETQDSNGTVQINSDLE